MPGGRLPGVNPRGQIGGRLLQPPRRVESRRVIEPKFGMPDLSAYLGNPARNADPDERHQQNNMCSGKEKRSAHGPNPECEHRNNRIRVEHGQPGVGQMGVVVEPGAPIAVEHIEDGRACGVTRPLHEHTRASGQRNQHETHAKRRSLAKHRADREHHEGDHKPGDGEVVIRTC